MAFDDELLTLMPSTLHVDAMSSVSTDGYLTPTFTTSASADYRCRHVTKQELVVNLFGEEQVANDIIWCKSSSTFGTNDKFTIGSSTLGPLIRVEHYTDQDGHNHSKLFFG